MKKDLREKIIGILLLIIFSPLILYASVHVGITTLFSIPKSKRKYKNSEYFKDIETPYYFNIHNSSEYRFYNSAKARMLPMKYIKQKSNDFEHFIFGNTAYIFPNFNTISFYEEKGIWQTNFDGYLSELEKEYRIMLNQFDTIPQIPIKFLIERKMLDMPNIENLVLPDCIYLTQSYEYAFKNDDARLLAKIPQTSAELYEMMLLTPDIAGSFNLVEETIHWQLTEKISAEITVGPRDGDFYILREVFGLYEDSITHWHPSPYEIYNDVCKIGLKGNILVIKGRSVLYMGDKRGYDCIQSDKKTFKNADIYIIGE